MDKRGWYQGGGIGLVDDKGRVAIPAALRQTLTANSPKADGKTGGSVVVGVHQHSKCVIAYDPDYVDVMARDLEGRSAAQAGPGGERDYNIKRKAAVGEATPFDGSGRFIMPAFPRFYAGIGTHAFFYGAFDWIEIWDPRTLIETPDAPDIMKQMVRFYLAEKGMSL